MGIGWSLVHTREINQVFENCIIGHFMYCILKGIFMHPFRRFITPPSQFSVLYMLNHCIHFLHSDRLCYQSSSMMAFVIYLTYVYMYSSVTNTCEVLQE